MSEVIQFPVSKKHQNSENDSAFDEELKSIPKKYREKIKFELIKTIDNYDAFFSAWSLDLPDNCSETLRKQIYDIAHLEHDRKMRMLKEIMRLKTKVLIAEYYQQI